MSNPSAGPSPAASWTQARPGHRECSTSPAPRIAHPTTHGHGVTTRLSVAASTSSDRNPETRYQGGDAEATGAGMPPGELGGEGEERRERHAQGHRLPRERRRNPVVQEPQGHDAEAGARRGRGHVLRLPSRQPTRPGAQDQEQHAERPWVLREPGRSGEVECEREGNRDAAGAGRPPQQ